MNVLGTDSPGLIGSRNVLAQGNIVTPVVMVAEGSLLPGQRVLDIAALRLEIHIDTYAFSAHGIKVDSTVPPGA